MTTVHVMLDIETWGTEPGCDIRSIGACVFDPMTGNIGTGHRIDTFHGSSPVLQCNTPGKFYVATMNGLCDWQNSEHGMPDEKYGYDAGTKLCRKYPLIRDPKTVQWWSEQTAEAQAAFANPVDLHKALERFADWLHLTVERGATSTPVNMRLWSHGPAFDPPILAAAYKAVGLPVPWHYRSPRDTRTAFDMAGIDDHSAFLAQFDTGTHHHALDDAICQARAVCEAYRLTAREPATADVEREDRAREVLATAYEGARAWPSVPRDIRARVARYVSSDVSIRAMLAFADKEAALSRAARLSGHAMAEAEGTDNNPCRNCGMEYSRRMQTAANTPPDELARIQLLADVELHLQSARIFLTKREKMHPCGVDLHDELQARVTAALADKDAG